MQPGHLLLLLKLIQVNLFLDPKVKVLVCNKLHIRVVKFCKVVGRRGLRIRARPGAAPRLVLWPEGVMRSLLETDYPMWVYGATSPYATRARLASVLGPRHKYFWTTVDDWSSLVNFGRSEPELIKKIPFFVGIAHLGYHVFPGTYGQIIEGHSTRIVNDPETLQTSPFNPLVLGGGPRGGPYKSGIVAVPPGYL